MLKYEIRRVQNCQRVDIVSIVIEALRTTPVNFVHCLKALNMPMLFYVLQKARLTHQKSIGYLRLWEVA